MSKLIKLKKKEYKTMNIITTKHNHNLKTVDDFYEEIKMNMNTHINSFVCLCRNLHLAHLTLDDKDYNKLVDSLKLARSTAYKYKNIVQHEYTEQLLETDQLPKKWTVLEQILKLNKDDFKKIKKDINFDTSAKEFKAMINVTPKISNNRQPLSMTTTCMNKQVYKYLSKKIEVLIKETNDHFKIANSAVLKLPTQKVSI